jgi:hypothetical protein
VPLLWGTSDCPDQRGICCGGSPDDGDSTSNCKIFLARGLGPGPSSTSALDSGSGSAAISLCTRSCGNSRRLGGGTVYAQRTETIRRGIATNASGTTSGISDAAQGT